jgi:hypothetical protein
MSRYEDEDVERDPEATEPEEGDWITEDHKTFYSYGRVILTLTGEETEREMWAAIYRTMGADSFWPNVWFHSDHGNDHLMVESEESKAQMRRAVLGR